MGLFGVGLGFVINILDPFILTEKVRFLTPPGLKNTVLGFLTILMLLVALVAQPVVGWLSDRTRSRWGRRAPYLTAGAIGLSLTLSLIVVVDSLWLLVAAVMLLSTASNTTQGAWQALIPDQVPETQHGLAAGLKTLSESVGVVAGVAVVGITLAQGDLWTAPLTGIGLFFTILFITLYVLGQTGEFRSAGYVKTQKSTKPGDRKSSRTAIAGGMTWLPPSNLPSVAQRGENQLTSPPLGRLLKKLNLGCLCGLNRPPQSPRGGSFGRFRAKLGAKSPQASPFGGREGAIQPANTSLSDFLSSPLGGIEGGLSAKTGITGIGLKAGVSFITSLVRRAPAAFPWWMLNRILFWSAGIAIRTFMLNYMEDVLAIPLAEAQALSSRFFLVLGTGVFLLALPAGAVADRLGRRPLLIVAGLLAAGGAVFFVFLRDLNLLLVGGGLIAVGAGIFASVSWALATDLAPGNEGAQYLALANVATVLGSIGGRMGGPLIDGVNRLTGTVTVGYLIVFGLATLFFAASSVVVLKIAEKPHS